MVDFIVCTDALIVGLLQLIPSPDLKHVIVNGRILDTMQVQTVYVGVTYVLCYSGSIFGYNDSPLFWLKDKESFSDSMLIRTEHEQCIDYLNYLQSDPELVVPGKRVQSFVNLFRSDPCLLYDNKFIGILRIQSLELNDTGTYDLHLEDQRGLILSNGMLTLSNIGQSSE